MAKITKEKIKELFEKWERHEEDPEECARRVGAYLCELLDPRSGLTQAQSDEIRTVLAHSDQHLDNVIESENAFRLTRSRNSKEKRDEDLIKLRGTLYQIKAVLSKYSDKETGPGPMIHVEMPTGEPTQPSPPDSIEAEISSLTNEIKMNPNDDSLCNLLGNAYFRKGDYDEAIRYYREAIKINPNVSVYHSNVGDACRGLLNWDEAISNYETALSIEERDDGALNGLGVALMAKGNYDEAIEKCLKAVQIHPLFSYYDNIADAYKITNNFDEAIEFYKEALKMNEKDDWAHNGLGICFLTLKKYDDAIFHFDQAARLDPNNFHYHANLGTAYSAQGEFGKATERYEEALRLNPDNYDTLSRLGDSKLREGKLEDAARHYEKAISTSREPSKEDYAALGDAYRRLGKIDEASKNYENALRIDSKDGLSLNGMGLILLSQNKNQEAAERFKQAINVNPNNFVYHSNLGVAYTNLGKLDDAIQSYKKALEKNPQDSRSYAGLGDCFARKGLFTKAIEQYEIAIRIEPTPDYYSRIGMAYQRQKNWEKAFFYLIKAVEDVPTDRNNVWNLSCAYNERGLEHYGNKEFDKAIEDYKRALQWSTDAVFHHNLYLAYLAENNYDEAEKHLRKAIELNPRPEYYNNLNQLKARRSKKQRKNAILFI